MYITDNVIRNKLHGFLNKSNKKKKTKNRQKCKRTNSDIRNQLENLKNNIITVHSQLTKHINLRISFTIRYQNSTVPHMLVNSTYTSKIEP